jgi:hypothetical protein
MAWIPSFQTISLSYQNDFPLQTRECHAPSEAYKYNLKKLMTMDFFFFFNIYKYNHNLGNRIFSGVKWTGEYLVYDYDFL